MTSPEKAPEWAYGLLLDIVSAYGTTHPGTFGPVLEDAENQPEEIRDIMEFLGV